MPRPLERRVRLNGVELTFFEWRAELRDGEPTLLFAHATGFQNPPHFTRFFRRLAGVTPVEYRTARVGRS